MRKITKTNFEELKTMSDLIKAIKHYIRATKNKSLIFFDTETTGLNIKYNEPFLLPWGYLVEDEAFIYCVDRTKNKDLFYNTAWSLIMLGKRKGLVGHNIKFDLHMLNNVGVELPNDIRYIDTMILIRAAHDALTPENGGPSLGLKEYSHKYIDKAAKEHEKIINSERQSIAKNYNRELKAKLYKLDKRWTLKYLDDYFKDVLNSVDTLDEKVKTTYLEWFNALPEPVRNNMTTGKVETNDIPYTLINRENLIKYAMYDIVWTMEVYLQCKPAIKARDMFELVRREEELIPALVRMEACGFQMNAEYIKESTKQMASYLNQQRTKLFNLVGELNVGQHAKIKEILITKYKLNVPGTGKEALERIYDELKVKTPDAEVVKFIGLVQELRTLEKWYSTYLLRFIREIEQGHTRIYTQINQVGTVSGRVTSDFQQFPKYGIQKDDGSDLFHPRKMVMKSPDCVGIAYLDYSQVELRLQAFYTILIGHPDLNLCRAYMPYKCKTKEGIMFDYKNKEHIRQAYTLEWFKEEDEEPWVPVDVHAATTHAAFPDVEVGTDTFKKLRNVGKRVNFAKNYGAQFNRIKVMFPEYDDETVRRIDEAYYKAFPGVKKYHEYCYNIVLECAGVSNLFGVKYYGLTGHKLINCLIQGSGAYLLKERIKAVDDYIQKNRLKTRIQMQIHDEVSYEIYPGEESHVKNFKEIMQTFEGTYVPIVADLEFTTNSWAEKEERDSL